jgi:hypothetical protein
MFHSVPQCMSIVNITSNARLELVFLLCSPSLPYTQCSYQILMLPVSSARSISTFMFSTPSVPKKHPLSTQRFLSALLILTCRANYRTHLDTLMDQLFPEKIRAFLTLNVKVVIGSTLVFQTRCILFDAGTYVAPLYYLRGYPR